ncbi:hypothetical protein V6U90_20725 [Micromonospora sp. CPCC 206060]|uniref:hypothetical protein n=1 Tax=Micromonospora sp. CPCC 206060 TaxID=3122406 RepID=UPI002FF19994
MSHSVAGEPPSTGHWAGAPVADYSVAEWELLTRLPGQVIVVATAPGPGRPRRGVAEGIAGLDGLAAGRAFDSDLVRAVAAAVYAESVAPRPRADPLTDLIDVLASCRAAVRVLGRRADPADSAAYRQWVQSVAARVCRASGAGDGDGGSVGSPADRRFLERLGEALGLR